MKSSASPVLLLVASLASAPAATNLFISSTPVISPPMVAPQIDARAWVNRALFGVTNFNSFTVPLPYESQGTLFFTNAPAPAGTMLGDPGFRFLNNVGGQRLWMDTWENHGVVATDHSTFFSTFGSSFLVGDSPASILQVAATNIISTGPLLQSGPHGLIRLEGQRIDLVRNAIRTGSTPLPPTLFGGGFSVVGASNYVNDVGITDLYWATGTNNSTRGGAGPMPIDGSIRPPDFSLPVPRSPSHDVISVSFGLPFTNTTVIPLGGLFGGSYAVAVNTNILSSTSSVVQVVFYPTNNLDPEASTEVRFSSGFGAASVVTVAFRSSEFDIATQTYSSNAVYFTDAMATTTNHFLSRNLAGNTRRPNTMEVSRVEPFTFSSGTPGNGIFTTNLLYNSQYTYPSVTNDYTAYSAQIELLSASPSGVIPYDVTNVPGRVEIIGNRVNLDQARIRAESAVIIKANDLVSNNLAQVNAPFVNLDVRSTQPTLTISNLAPPTVKRFGGSIRAWSAVWQNQDAVPIGTSIFTNYLTFHVLIVDSDLQSILPVSVNEFAARATNVVISDQLNITKSFVLEGNSALISGGLNLPLGASLGATNLINLYNFTNDGIIQITGTEWFGTDRQLSYSNYVNHGTNQASGHFIRTRNFENSGTIGASGGLLTIDALTASMVGSPQVETTSIGTNIFFDPFFGLQTNVITITNVLSAAPQLQGVGEVQLNVNDLIVSNSIINAGRLILAVTNKLLDAGPNGVNHWATAGGFSALLRPATSDLAATYLRSSAPRLLQVDHFWAGRDQGASPAGFTNNLALGKLILDGGSNSLFRFFAAGPGSNALYVDYLQFDNFATNYNAELSIATDFTIYFANANLPATKLDGAAGGRLRWVQDYTGPLSSTNLTYFFTNGPTVTSNVYTFNVALVTSRDLDSDFDGIVNGDDPTPIYVAQNAVLAASLLLDSGPQVQLSWKALAYSSNHIEYRSGPSGGWQSLTNFLHGPFTAPVQILDPIPTNGTRVYRLRVDRGPFFN
ncbi:MAG TPA: hypothetical protein VNU68_31985 [Verrucomicrobiae bacterium]|nr:hypothetical protein [Verrucomicrobiae bacterium]